MTKGFTLIELLVTIAIIALLSAIILPNFRTGEKEYAIQRSAHKLARDLRRAQEMAMSLKMFGEYTPSGYGVYLTTSAADRYILFADLNGNQDYDGGNEKAEEIIFEGGVRITFLSGSPLEIVFSPPDPIITIRPSAPAAVITLEGRKTVRVNSAGLIAVE